MQKKTFTKWVNSHLVRINCKITDLYTDLRDGKMRIKLLEILSGERLPRPTKGKRVYLENMRAHDIVDGSPRLTLSLIWTIILKFQIPQCSSTPSSTSRADLIQYNKLSKSKAMYKLNNSFEVVH